MAKTVGLAIDFTASGYKALEWANKHISWGRNDSIFIIHVRQSDRNAPNQVYESVYKRIEKIPTGGRQEKWEDIKKLAFQFKCKDNIVAKVHESNNIPEKLREVGMELNLDLLVVGSAANGGPNSNAEVGRYLARCEANWSLVIAK